MRLRWFSGFSLRTKATGITLAITSFSLAVVAVAGILQLRSQIEAEQHHTADSLSLSIARASELALTVGDSREMTRLANSFLRDPDILFIAAYSDRPTPLAIAVRDQQAWENYQNKQVDSSQCIVGEHVVEGMSGKDEFNSALEVDPAEPANDTAVHRKGLAGRVVVGLSTDSARAAQLRQSRVTVATAIVAAVLSGLALFVTLGNWTRRLDKLDVASQSIARGNFSDFIEDYHDDEIGRLARSLEEMRQALLQRDQKLQRFTDTLQDQVKQRTHDLERAVSAAEEASRAKSLFLANMSHELRTPLNGVIGMVDLLLATPTSPQQRRYCDMAKISARSLLDLISDILDFSKIEAGKLELDASDFDLHKMVEDAMQLHADRAQKKNLELICNVSQDVPRYVNGDSVRIRQVVTNLISNAIKFTEQGEVVLEASVLDQDATHATVKIEVRDTGVGIPKDRLNRLFKSFSQVDASTTRKFGGTGLGLAISQRIVEMMSGKMGVESENGKGSKFWFTARLAKRATTPIQQPALVDPRGLHVLVVDDNATNREILLSQLTRWSLRADVASGAGEAMQLLHASVAAGDPYRLAILDMHMPDTDGAQLAQKIRTDPETRGVILIGLSSMGDQFRPAEIQKMGFAAWLAKPALPSSLYDEIVSSLARDQKCENRSAPAEKVVQHEKLLTGVRVLLAEDHEINRMVASELLRQAGCDVTMADNGRQAVEAVQRESYDVILMDCQMPEMDGFEATRTIREAERLSNPPRRVPIVALTANAIKGDQELCLAAGMDGYVSKPIDPAALFKAIHQQLPEDRQLQLPPVSDAATSPTPPNETTPMSGEAPVDFDTLRRRCMGNRRLAGKALEMFDSSIDSYVDELARNFQASDGKSAASMAHKIRGAAANVSAEPIRRIANELENLAKQDALLQAGDAIAGLRCEVERVREFVATSLKQLASAPADAASEDLSKAK